MASYSKSMAGNSSDLTQNDLASIYIIRLFCEPRREMELL